MACCSALDLHKASSWPLAKLLLGHGSDPGFVSGSAVASAVSRALRIAPLGWREQGLVGRVRSFLAAYGNEVRPWVWSISGEVVDLAQVDDGRLQRLLRDAWRLTCWEAHRQSGRRDAALGVLDPRSVKVAQKLVTQHGRHALSILTGGWVSDARLASNRGEDISPCWKCGAEIPDRQHEMWICTDPPGVPQGSAQQILGWPVVGCPFNDALMQHLVKCRTERLQRRYGR